MEIEAKVKRVEATKEVGANGFKMRNLIVETEEQYPQVLAIQFVQDKVSLLDSLQANDKLRIHLTLRGREVSKEGAEPAVYNTIQGWKFEKL